MCLTLIKSLDFSSRLSKWDQGRTTQLSLGLQISKVREFGVGRLGRIIDQSLRDVHNITRKECPGRFAQFLRQQPKETKEVSVSSFAANPNAVQDRRLRNQDHILQVLAVDCEIMYLENIQDEAWDAHVPMFVTHTQVGRKRMKMWMMRTP